MADSAVDQDSLVIPLIDFSLFLHGMPTQRQETASQILNGFRTAGFVYLKNHGVDTSTIESIFVQSAAFFARPQHEKDELRWYSPEANRGYTAHGREKVTQLANKDDVEALRKSVPDLKESLEIGREGEAGCPNMWPSTEDEAGKAFKEVSCEFFSTCKNLYVEVMRAIAAGLGIRGNWFDDYTDRGDNTLRLLHYPSVKKAVFEKNNQQLRAGAHSDYGAITLLFQDAAGGLQVESPNGTFVDATPIPGTIVVNAGDMLARWSNDIIKSTKHRVVEPPRKPEKVVGDEYPARYSIAYFCNPNFSSQIEAIPSTYKGNEVPKYESINSREYLVRRLATTY